MRACLILQKYKDVNPRELSSPGVERERESHQLLELLSWGWGVGAGSLPISTLAGCTTTTAAAEGVALRSQGCHGLDQKGSLTDSCLQRLGFGKGIGSGLSPH